MTNSSRVAFRFFKAKFLKMYSPLFVGWAVTNRCNSRCKYCSRWKNIKEELNTDEIMRVVYQLSRMGTCKINFAGGEPLLREDLPEILNFAKKLKIKVMITSNGILIPKKVNILEIIDGLALSLDGPQEEHDFLRGAGTHKCVIEAAEIAKKNRIKLEFSTVISRVNISHLDYLIDIAQQYDAKIFFSPVNFLPFASDEVESLLPDKEKFYMAIDRLIKQKRLFSMVIANSLSNLYYLRAWPEARKLPACAAGKILCRIESDGNVYGCNYIPDNPPLNCKVMSFKEIFRKLLKQDQCRKCWCGDKIEVNLLYSLRLDTIVNIFKFELKGP